MWLLVLLLWAWADAIIELEPDDDQCPDPSAIVPIDLRNAYGLFYRSHALQAAVDFNADVAALAAAEWGVKPEYWIEVDGQWKLNVTHRGFWQGRRLAMLMFCLSLSKSLLDPSLALKESGLACASIQDDTYLVGSLHTFAEKRAELLLALGKGGHELQPAKCKAWAPAWDGIATGALPQWAQELFQQLQRAEGGVLAMGAASQGQHEFLLGPWSIVAAKARERLVRAQGALQELRAYVREAESPHSLHLAWSVLSRSIAQALTYDCRLVPPETLSPIAVQLDTGVRCAIGDLVGRAIDDDQWAQLTLPGPLGGCGVLSTRRRSSAAFASTWLLLRERLHHLCNAFARPATLSRQDAEAAKAVAELEGHGVLITDSLGVQFEPSAKIIYEASPFAKDVAAEDLPQNRYDFDASVFHGSGLLSRVSRVAAAVQAAQLYTRQVCDSRKTALLSASGESVGQFWTHIPAHRNDIFENLWFRSSLRQRLHLAIISSGQRCQLRQAERREELCLEELTERHLYCCQSGMARFRPHKNLVVTLASALRDLGAFVDVERYCAELISVRENGETVEAWLDVCA